MKAAFISVALVAVLARAAHVDERSNALHAQTVVVDHHNVHERDLLENIDLITAQDMEGTDESLLRGAQSTWSIVSGLFSFDWFLMFRGPLVSRLRARWTPGSGRTG